MKKVAFYTLGCKVNQYETQAIKEKFIQKGYEIVHENEPADVNVINTCTVTNLSDRKSRQYIRRAKRLNPDSIVIVTGCYAQISPKEIEALEDVNIVIGINEKNKIVEYADAFKGKEKTVKIRDYDELLDYEEMLITSMDMRTRAYIKIQEGCNQFCSYCIIPYARGNIRSRKGEHILKEAKTLIANGYKEIVITGINAALYGVDSGEGSLLDVIENINAISGKFRIRLSSLEPAVMDQVFIDKLMSFSKLCSHLHLSLQNGSDKILKSMNRKYSTDRYKEIVHKLREQRYNMNITTDIIVGFPGETQKDFEDTCNFVKSIGFGKVHVFKYSKRKGTKAAEMEHQVDPSTKNKRSEYLLQLADHAAYDYMKKFICTSVEVLFETKDEKTGYYEGLSDNYLKVYCKNKSDLKDRFALVYVENIFKDGLTGKIEKIY